MSFDKERSHFRGRDKKGKWQVGTLAIAGDKPFIVRYVNRGGCDVPVVIPVDPLTVGQATGFHDRNGEMIYEGDRVRIYRDTTACIRWGKEEGRWEMVTPLGCYEIGGTRQDDMEIVKIEIVPGFPKS